MRAIERGTRATRAGRALLDRIPVPRADDAERRLHVERRRLERLRRLAEIYGPYVELDCIFDDSSARALSAELAPADREALDFDTAAIDWAEYLDRVHLPALRRLVSPSRPPRRTGASATAATNGSLADGPAAIAFLDVEADVVLDTTIAHFYAWLRSRGMPGPDRAAFMAGLAARAPGWALADRRSRAGFNRSFYRTYRGLPAAELRAEADAALDEHILPRVQQAAVRRISAHRRRGDRVCAHGRARLPGRAAAGARGRAISASLVEEAGVFTGELAAAPMTAEGRAAEAARSPPSTASARGLPRLRRLDLRPPLLECVGHAHPVNPDFRLERESWRRGWQTLHGS